MVLSSITAGTIAPRMISTPRKRTPIPPENRDLATAMDSVPPLKSIKTSVRTRLISIMTSHATSLPSLEMRFTFLAVAENNITSAMPEMTAPLTNNTGSRVPEQLIRGPSYMNSSI